MKDKKGLIQVYTDDGKGKTTASIGLAIRAISYDFGVCFITLFKPHHIFEQGQGKTLRKLGIDVHNLIPKKLHSCKKAGYDKVRKRCLELLPFIEKILKENYDLLRRQKALLFKAGMSGFLGRSSPMESDTTCRPHRSRRTDRLKRASVPT